MTAKIKPAEEPEKTPSPAELARLYLDLWEKSLCLYAREGISVEPGTGSPPAQPG